MAGARQQMPLRRLARGVHAEIDEPLAQPALQGDDCESFIVRHKRRGETLAPSVLDADAADRVRVGGRMRLTIDNLNGVGETDYTALLDAGAPPKIVRKLNQPPVFTAWLVCHGVSIVAAAGSKLRLYRDSGALWFSGYLADAPQPEFAGELMGIPVLRVALNALGEMSALDRSVLSEHAAMGGDTAGQALTVLTREANSAIDVSAVQDVAEAGTITVETGESWSAAAGEVANCARAVLTVQNRALAMTPVGTVTRALTDSDPSFAAGTVKLTLSGAAANDVTVIGGTEPALYVRDCITATGTKRTFALSRSAFKLKTAIQVEDDFHSMALDTTKWVSDFPAPLTFTQGGVACAGQVALRYRDRLEIGGLILLEQTGISYVSGEGVVGGLFSGGFALNDCIAGVVLNGGQVQPVINGVLSASVKQLSASKLYEFRTIVFHPEPIRAGQVYSSSVCNGISARSSQVWFGTTHIVLTMREIDPADASTTSTPQVVIYDGTLQNVPAYADYEPLWGLNLTCTLGHACATNYGAVWVQSAVSGQAWRTRLIGDVAAGAECYFTAGELHFTTTTEPVAGEQLEIFYRAPGLACGRVVDSASVQALANSEGSGTRSIVLRVTAPAPRTSLDCEQAARALLDDLTQPGCSGEYQSWIGSLPQGATDVQPGEQWNISAASLGVRCAVVVREVEIDFQDLTDQYAQFKLHFANDAAQPFTFRFGRAKHNALITVVASEMSDDVSARPCGLPDARVTAWSTKTLTLDAGIAPVPGGGIEVRVEGDWGWGMAMNQNLVGRFTGQTFTLPNTGVTQTFYLRQFDGSTPAKYSPYATVLNLEV
jgi:hypothetical protein